MSTAKKLLRYEGVELRVQLVALGIAMAFSVLCIQLWRLQVIHQVEYQSRAEENRVWPQRLKSDRGLICANDGTVLADNRASADIMFVPGECPKDRHQEVCDTLGSLLTDLSSEKLLKTITLHKRTPFTQILVKRDVSKAERVRIEEHSYRLPGVFSVVRPVRRYLYGKTAGQILGYLNEINQEEYKTWDGYSMGDLVGRSGVERQYEEQMHGRDGYMLVTKYASGLPQLRTDNRGVPYIAPRDSLGNVLEEEGNRLDPLAGKTLHLTLDIKLQQFCESLLADVIGAIAVLDADTGAVLALASSPGYDPSVFVDPGRSNREECKTLLSGTNPNRMKHRAMSEHYPPGSVFKVLLAAAALEEKVITPETTFFCPGHFQINGVGNSWNCWQHHGHGSVNVIQALAFSCDVFFYNVGLKLGIDKMSEYCHKAALGEKTGIDIPGETSGLIADREWKKAMNKDKPVWEQNWYPGETVNMSVGQGGAATTPLQNAVLIACILNGGYRIQPYLSKDLGPRRLDRIFSDATIEIVTKGMRMCVEKGPPAPSGTGHLVYTPGMAILGKTGSAQVASLKVTKHYKNELDIPYELRDHAWFVAGVLDRTPKLAMCILVEHGLHGRDAASPLAKAIIDFYYGPAAPAPDTLARVEGH